MTDAEKIQAAIDLAVQYGSIDGAHHKQWVIDQMLRRLMSDAEYDKFVSESDKGPNGEADYYMPWDKGIAP